MRNSKKSWGKCEDCKGTLTVPSWLLCEECDRKRRNARYHKWVENQKTVEKYLKRFGEVV